MVSGLNWSADRPIEEWDGVTVGEQGGGEEEDAPMRVIGLDLGARGLSGRIPPDLGDPYRPSAFGSAR